MAGARSCFCISTASSLTSCISNSGVEVVILVLDLVPLIVILFASSNLVQYMHFIQRNNKLLCRATQCTSWRAGIGTKETALIFSKSLNDKHGVHLFECTVECMSYGIFLLVHYSDFRILSFSIRSLFEFCNCLKLCYILVNCFSRS